MTSIQKNTNNRKNQKGIEGMRNTKQTRKNMQKQSRNEKVKWPQTKSNDQETSRK